MKPKAKPTTNEVPLLATMRLDLAVDLDHELVHLAGIIPWAALTEDFGPLYCADNGRPGVPIRLMVGLHFLKHLKGISDEQTVRGWVENPYWQFLCGEEFFQHTLPIDPSQMTRWRQRIGEEGVERLLQAPLTAGNAAGILPEESLDRIIVDTTVQPKPPVPTMLRQKYSERLRYSGHGRKLDEEGRQSRQWRGEPCPPQTAAVHR